MFPLSVALPIAVSLGAAWVLQYAVAYLFFRMDVGSSDDRVGTLLQRITSVLTFFVAVAGFVAILLFPSLANPLSDET